MSRGYTARNVTKDDHEEIASLVCEQEAKWFGNKRPKYEQNQILKRYQTHRIVVHPNDKKTPIVGYAEFRNYPTLGPLLNDCWLEWLNERYCINFALSMTNTMFLNFGVYRTEHPDALLALLDEVFYREVRLRYLIAVRTPVLAPDAYYAESFEDLEKVSTVFYPREFSIGSNSNTQSVFVMERLSLLPRISYRKALPEDNDDIIEMHGNELPELRAQMGDFYIAEELMRTDEGAKNSMIIMAELENANKEITPGAFIWLDANVDIRFYVKNFEMEMFGNLIKFCPNRPYECEHIPVISVERKAEAKLFTADAMDDLSATTIIGGVQHNDSGTSVASLSKIQVSSNRGNIDDSTFTSSQDKFYLREDLYNKFVYIFTKLLMIDYYITEENRFLNLFYNTDHKKPGEDGIQNASNVFELKYICASKDFPLERLFSCIVATFSAFPNRDYCIMTIPKSSKFLRSHMEVLKYFMPVGQRSSDVTDLQEIYIAHRSTIFGEIGIYRLESEDIPMVLNMLKGCDRSNMLINRSGSSFSYSSKVNAFVHIDNEINVVYEIMNDVLSNQSSKYDVFTIRCGDSTKSAKENTAVGYVVLRRFLDHYALHHHYHLPKNDQHLENHRAEILSLRLHPFFNNNCDVIMRSLAAKTNYFDFFYIFARNRYIFSNDLKTMMMLIEPKVKKQIRFDYSERINDEETKSINGLPPLDFYHDLLVVFRHKLSPAQWFGTPKKLLIIGFTAMSKAFLRQLIFLWNSKDHKNSESYTCLSRLQVTVIAPPGLVEAEYDFMFDCPYCKLPTDCYLFERNCSSYVRDVILRIDLRLWVHFVTGRVNFIQREKKYVKINYTCEVYYDNLLLMNDMDFSLHHTHSTDHMGHLPSNFLEINNRLDKLILFYKLRVLLEDHKLEYQILIYGSNLQTYECIAFLLSHGAAPERIILVVPHRNVLSENDQKLKNPFIDENIESIVDEMLEDLQVKIYRNLIFSHWVTHDTANFIIEVVFTKYRKTKEKSFDCDIFIAFEEGHMDIATKGWLNVSDIKLNGRNILVNKNFQTNDPNIYAAGKFIELTDSHNHQYQYTNEKETASKLMQIMGLRTFETPLDYKYSEPTFFKARLPLEYRITKVIMPRRYLASHVIGCPGCTMTTYNDYTFCRIGLSPKMMVDEIVIVTRDITPLDYLEHFCGKHEKMLNNMSARFAAGNIKCFLKFLGEPWTELIIHQDFADFQAVNHRILTPMIKDSLDSNSCTTKHNLHEVNQLILEHNLLDFIRKRRQDFHHEFALPEDYVYPKSYKDT